MVAAPRDPDVRRNPAAHSHRSPSSGVSKVRITGGEPLTRRGIVDFVRQIPEIPRITSIGLSTNGTLLAREIAPGKTMAEALRDAGVQSVNISLDTLDAAVYSQITGRDFHAQVLAWD